MTNEVIDYKKKAEELAQNGLIRVPELAETFTVNEYANLLKAKEEARIKEKVDAVQKEVEVMDRLNEVAEAEALLNDPRIKRLFNI